MTRFVYKNQYLRAFDSLGVPDQRLVVVADSEIRSFCFTGKASYGLRIKKLYSSKGGQIFEARISAALRIIWVRHQDIVYFQLLGDHDTVRKFLKKI